MKVEWVQFKTPLKQELKKLAKEKGMTLNSLMQLICEMYIKSEGK